MSCPVSDCFFLYINPTHSVAPVMVQVALDTSRRLLWPGEVALSAALLWADPKELGLKDSDERKSDQLHECVPGVVSGGRAMVLYFAQGSFGSEECAWMR